MKKFWMTLLILVLIAGLGALLYFGRLGNELGRPDGSRGDALFGNLFGTLGGSLDADRLGDLLQDSEEADGEAGRVAEDFLRALNEGDLDAAGALLTADGLLPPPTEAQTDDGRALAGAVREPYLFTAASALRRESDTATLTVDLYAPDPAVLQGELNAAMQAVLDERLEAATRTEEVLTRELSVREELLGGIGSEAMARVCEGTREAVRRGSYTLTLRREARAWRVADCTALLTAAWADDYDALAAAMLGEAAAALVPVPKVYTLPVDANRGQAPDPEGFGVTDDPQVILELLQRPEAQRLLEGRELIWDPEIERFPDSQIHYYLDQTILVLVWQEVTAWAQGTYAEVIVADGSQLCRKLSEDDFDAQTDHFPTTYAEETQAVLTIGGDFYRYPGRNNGICVYEGQIRRFEPDTSDSCFVTDRGEFLFVYRGQFKTEEEAQAYVDENHVRFSLCFGPVVIEDGENVMPDRYRWGEIWDHYARALIGCREEGHYLALTVNAKTPGYYYLATLQAAVEAMLEHGVQRAYTLDGGQTATIVLGSEVINTVQFGAERAMSDVLFFGSALPPEAGW